MPGTATPKAATQRTSAGSANGGVLRLRDRPLRDLAEESLLRYFRDLNGTRPRGLYELVIREVEQPLFRTVMEFAEGNQSLAAEILGINRATLRKKLRLYGLLG